MVKKTTLDDLANILNQHGGALNQHGTILTQYGKEIRDLTETMTHVVRNMATKQDVAELREEVSEIRSVMVTKTGHEAFRQECRDQYSRIAAGLASINRRLEKLEEEVAGLKGFAREIDDIRARVKDIEKHLGLNRKIAA